MIIGCPSCNTKFAVDAQQLAEVENPRFHCSRCGHVFDIKEDAEKSEETNAREETPLEESSSPEMSAVEDDSVTHASADEEFPQKHDATKDAPSERFLMEDWAQAEQDFAEEDVEESVYSEAAVVDELEAEQVDSSDVDSDFSDDESFTSRFAQTDSSEDEEFDDFPQVTAEWPSGPANEPYEVAPFIARRGNPPAPSPSTQAKDTPTDSLEIEAVEEDDDIFSGTAQWSSLRDVEDQYEVEPDLGAWQTGEEDFDSSEDEDEDFELLEAESHSEEAASPEDSVLELEAEEQEEQYIDPAPLDDKPQGLKSDSTAIKKIEPFTGVVEEDEAASFDDTLPIEEEPQWQKPQALFDAWTSGEDSVETEADETDEIEEVLRPGAEKKSLRQTFTEVVLRRADDEPPKEHIKKVIDLKESPSLEKERAKRRAKRRAAQHDRLLQDAIEHPDTAFPPPKQSVITGAGAVVIMWSVPLMLMGLFWFWGSSVAQTPEPLKQLFRLDSEYLPKPAPAGLALVDLSSEIIALDDGSKIMEVRGAIFNATVETFSEVKLEAKTYDESNQVLSEELVSYNNGLMNAKLGALQLNAIKSLQSKQGAAVVEITPNLKVPFRVILTEFTGDEKWFSARVYSVHPKA